MAICLKFQRIKQWEHVRLLQLRRGLHTFALKLANKLFVTIFSYCTSPWKLMLDTTLSTMKLMKMKFISCKDYRSYIN